MQSSEHTCDAMGAQQELGRSLATVHVSPQYSRKYVIIALRDAILELATNFWLLVLSILHNHKRIIKQASLSYWVAEYNLKVSSASIIIRPMLPKAQEILLGLK